MKQRQRSNPTERSRNPIFTSNAENRPVAYWKESAHFHHADKGTHVTDKKYFRLHEKVIDAVSKVGLANVLRMLASDCDSIGDNNPGLCLECFLKHRFAAQNLDMLARCLDEECK